MTKRTFTLSCLASCLVLFGAQAYADAAPTTAVVSFRRCVEESAQGKAEQTAFEALKNQMNGVLEKTDKELEEISKKLQDPEYLDGLSPEAEQELRNKFDGLSQEMARYQNQYYQILNQANMKVMQTLSQQVANAAQSIAKQDKYAFVLSEDACFFYAPDYDITAKVIAEMNKNYSSAQTPQTAQNLSQIEATK